VTPHGFRSCFRDWCAERTNFPSEVAEMALAHRVAAAVERAYRRGDLFEKRRQLMEAWGRFCETSSMPVGDVVPLHEPDRIPIAAARVAPERPAPHRIAAATNLRKRSAEAPHGTTEPSS
jgi:hypothetical protein